MHLSNESNLASGPTFPRSRVTFYNSNQDLKGGGIAGVEVEFMQPLFSEVVIYRVLNIANTKVFIKIDKILSF